MPVTTLLFFLFNTNQTWAKMPAILRIANVTGKHYNFANLQGVFFWYLLFSLDNSRILKPVGFADEVVIPKRIGLPFLEGFVGSIL